MITGCLASNGNAFVQADSCEICAMRELATLAISFVPSIIEGIEESAKEEHDDTSCDYLRIRSNSY